MTVSPTSLKSAHYYTVDTTVQVSVIVTIISSISTLKQLSSLKITINEAVTKICAKLKREREKPWYSKTKRKKAK